MAKDPWCQGSQRESAPRWESRLLDPKTQGSLERGSRRLRSQSDRTDASSIGYLGKDGQPAYPSVWDYWARVCAGRVPGNGPCSQRQKTAGSVQRTGCSLCSQGAPVSKCPRAALALPQAPTRALRVPAPRPHTCSPRWAPSPSPEATPCDSGYRRDHRAGAGDPRGESQHRSGLRSDGGLGAGPCRGGAGPCQGGAGQAAQPDSRATWWPGGVGLAPAWPQASLRVRPEPTARMRTPSSELLCPRKEQVLAEGWPRPEGRRCYPHAAPRSKVRLDQGERKRGLAGLDGWAERARGLGWGLRGRRKKGKLRRVASFSHCAPAPHFLLLLLFSMGALNL